MKYRMNHKSLKQSEFTFHNQFCRIFYLQNNRINSLARIQLYSNLVYLDMNTNKISQIVELNMIQSLKILILSNNQIKVIENLPNGLLILNLQNNKINRITNLESSTQLKVLNLNNNQINHVQILDNLFSLQKLFLDNNAIESLANLPSLPEMQHLSVQNNQVRKFMDLRTINRLFIKIVEIKLKNNPLTKDNMVDNYLEFITNCQSPRCYSQESYSKYSNKELARQITIQKHGSQSTSIPNYLTTPRIQSLIIKGQKQSLLQNQSLSYSRQLLNQQIISYNFDYFIIQSRKVSEKTQSQKYREVANQKQLFQSHGSLFNSPRQSQQKFQSLNLTIFNNSITDSDYFSENHDKSRIREIKQEWLQGKHTFRSYIKLKANTLYCYGNPLEILVFMNNYFNSIKFHRISQSSKESKENLKKKLFSQVCFGFCEIEDILKIQFEQEICSLNLKFNRLKIMNQMHDIAQHFPLLKKIAISNNEILNSSKILQRFLISELKSLEQINDLLIPDDEIAQAKKLFYNYEQILLKPKHFIKQITTLKISLIDPKQKRFDEQWEQYIEKVVSEQI